MSLAAVFSLGSCSQEDLADVQKEDEVKLGIKSISATVQSRSTGVIEDYLPQNAKMGIFFREEGKTTYDGSTYNNILCTQTSITNGWNQTWDINEDILLSTTEGKGYLYYPYQQAATDITAIPIDCSDGNTDFLYSYGIASHNTNWIEASLDHLCAWIQINITQGNYMGTGKLTEIGFGNLAGTKGTFNLITEEFTPASGDYGGLYITDNLGNFKNGDLTYDILVIPSKTKNPNLWFYVDNIEFNGKSFTTPWKAGYKYTYNVTISENQYVDLTLISVHAFENGGTESWTDKPLGQQ